MTVGLKTEKVSLRNDIRTRLKSMTPDQRAVASQQACALLEQQPLWKQAKLILFYAPLPQEIDLWRLLQDSIAAGKTTALPRLDAATQRYVACEVKELTRDLKHGEFGIREPAGHCMAISSKPLDLILVPGVAFDLQGRRLGRGKGFYDQLLASVRGMTCGVAFDEQIVDRVPVEPHDIHLNCILTPTRWIEPWRAILK